MIAMNTSHDFQHHFHSGLSGLQLPIPKYLFPFPYENASRLTFYAFLFNSIELIVRFIKFRNRQQLLNGLPQCQNILGLLLNYGMELHTTYC